MTRFALGALLIGACWALYTWFKNPMGHRGGQEEFEPVPAPAYRGGNGSSVPINYHRYQN